MKSRGMTAAWTHSGSHYRRPSEKQPSQCLPAKVFAFEIMFGSTHTLIELHAQDTGQSSSPLGLLVSKPPRLCTQILLQADLDVPIPAKR